MDMDDDKERRALYAKTREDLLARNLSNSEKFDAAILTLSMAALGVSLTLIRGGKGLENAHHGLYLVVSWWCFGLAIISTMLSFYASQSAINKQLDYADKYYLQGKPEYLNKTSVSHVLTDSLNYASGILFIVAIMLTIVFVSANLRGL
jgi:hypothetical protein